MSYHSLNRIYYFVGNVVLREEYYTAPGLSPQTVRYSCTYDSRGRQLSEQTTVNGTTQSTVATAYDALGRVQSTQFPAIGVSQTSEYDIRGWLTSLQSAPFSQSLRYTSPAPGFSTPSYTGNITQWSWRHGADSPESSYAFCYDALSRLTDTKQYVNGVVSDQFVERDISYDRNGNLQTLRRTSSGILSDNLNYHYSGNKLMSLGGSRQATYSYDCMGNMTRDGVHNLDLSYNYLNLLKKVTQLSSTIANYRYLWDGTKVSATNGSGNGLSYQGSLVYNKQGSTLTPESISFSGGRIVATNNGLETHYFISDHLGSVRVIVNGNGSILERNDYHPYGLRWNDNQLSDNRHRYNGKEEQMFVNIPYIDYGARQYDPKYRLQWNGGDMLSEKNLPVGTHVFCNNNPIRYMDPDGKIPVETIWDVANVIAGSKSFSNNIKAGNYGGAVVDALGVVVDCFATALPFVPGGAGSLIKATRATDKAIDGLKGADKAVDAATAVDKGADVGRSAKTVKNPNGAKGAADHQAKIEELVTTAAEANPGMKVLTEKKIQVPGSSRRPDVQVVDPKTDMTIKVYEAERLPASKRNKMREAEYQRLGIPYETHPVGNK